MSEAEQIEYARALSIEIRGAIDGYQADARLCHKAAEFLLRVAPRASYTEMLAGAALEEALRSLVESDPTLTVNGKPGLNSYSTGLQTVGLIDNQQKKDIDAWAGLRNSAAHGDFDAIKRENASLMEQGVNLFLQQMRP